MCSRAHARDTSGNGRSPVRSGGLTPARAPLQDFAAGRRRRSREMTRSRRRITLAASALLVAAVLRLGMHSPQAGGGHRRCGRPPTRSGSYLRPRCRRRGRSRASLRRRRRATIEAAAFDQGRELARSASADRPELRRRGLRDRDRGRHHSVQPASSRARSRKIVGPGAQRASLGPVGRAAVPRDLLLLGSEQQRAAARERRRACRPLAGRGRLFAVLPLTFAPRAAQPLPRTRRRPTPEAKKRGRSRLTAKVPEAPVRPAERRRRARTAGQAASTSRSQASTT